MSRARRTVVCSGDAFGQTRNNVHACKDTQPYLVYATIIRIDRSYRRSACSRKKLGKRANVCTRTRSFFRSLARTFGSSIQFCSLRPFSLANREGRIRKPARIRKTCNKLNRSREPEDSELVDRTLSPAIGSRHVSSRELLDLGTLLETNGLRDQWLAAHRPVITSCYHAKGETGWAQNRGSGVASLHN